MPRHFDWCPKIRIGLRVTFRKGTGYGSWSEEIMREPTKRPRPGADFRRGMLWGIVLCAPVWALAALALYIHLTAS